MPVEQLDALENAAKRQKAEEDAAEAIKRTRVKLLLGSDPKSAFFATLGLRLKAEPCWTLPTAATDGKRLLYNPDFINGLTSANQLGVMVHEIMHCALSHQARRQQRDPAKYNIAADLSINPLIAEAGYSLPTGGLFPGKPPFKNFPPGLSAEEYYPMIPDQPKGDGKGDDPGGCGGVTEPEDGDEATARTSEAEWRVAVAQAASAAKQRGKLPGGLARLVDEIVEPTVTWQEELREFVSRTLTAKDDYSWSHPNRRFITQGLHLPSLKSESMGEVVVAVDTSGSIGQKELTEFGGELNGILECKPCRVTVVYCDAAIQGVQEWEPTDGPLTLEAKGGGGTSHVPVWEYLKEHDGDPACLICLSDGCTNFGGDPGLPVLWALNTDVEPPFGKAIRIGGKK